MSFRRIGVVLGMLMLLSGCVRVRPWQREYLSHRGLNMAAERNEARFKQHLFEAREGARGGTGDIGGGCGCN
jgi:hypothetical protein